MMKIFYRNNKLSWWRIAGATFVLSGLELLVIDGIGGNWIGGALVGGVNILVGMGLWRESLLIFRIVRMIFLAAFGIMLVSWLSQLGNEVIEVEEIYEYGIKQIINILTTILNVAMLGALGMLWKELRKEKKLKW